MSGGAGGTSSGVEVPSAHRGIEQSARTATTVEDRVTKSNADSERATIKQKAQGWREQAASTFYALEGVAMVLTAPALAALNSDPIPAELATLPGIAWCLWNIFQPWSISWTGMRILCWLMLGHALAVQVFGHL